MPLHLEEVGWAAAAAVDWAAAEGDPAAAGCARAHTHAQMFPVSS